MERDRRAVREGEGVKEINGFRTCVRPSIINACNTSVRETAMNPPTNVYVATAKSVKMTPAVGLSPSISSSSFDPPTSPELT